MARLMDDERRTFKNEFFCSILILGVFLRHCQAPMWGTNFESCKEFGGFLLSRIGFDLLGQDKVKTEIQMS